MGRKVLTYTTEKHGYCEIHVDTKNEMFYIKYFDNNGRQFFVEDYPNKSLREVEQIANEWCSGNNKLVEGL